MADEQWRDDGVEAERGVTPVAGRTEASSQQRTLKRGMGAAAMVCFVALLLWSTWQPEGGGRAEEREQQLVVRQTTPFEPAREPPAPVQQAALQPEEAIVPPPLAQLAPAPPMQDSAADELLESSRRAPLIVYSRPQHMAEMGGAHSAESYAPDYLPDGYGAVPGPRNELLDRLKPTPIEGVRAARLPNRHLIVAQGTPIPCVLETAMSSDVPGFVSCIVMRDVMSDSGQVVLMEKGTQVVGEYRGGVRRGSRRMFVLWTRAKTPTGVIVNLASPATDALGRSGFDGNVDTHFWERFGAGVLLSIVDGAGSYAGRQFADGGVDIGEVGAAGSSAAAVAVERSIDIAPTLHKPQGESVNIFVARDLDFSSVYGLQAIDAAEPYYGAVIPAPVYKP
jgi:type IV secretion system protein VirB10